MVMKCPKCGKDSGIMVGTPTSYHCFDCDGKAIRWLGLAMIVAGFLAGFITVYWS